MLGLLKYAHRTRGKLESRGFDRAAAEPEKTQRRLLLDLLGKNAATRFGRAHGFAGIRCRADFQKQVPVRGYEDFRPYINRLIIGEKAVLTKADPLMLTMTSGTTSEPKYIPVTPESQARNASLMRQWLFRAEQDHTGLTACSSVGIVSRAIEGRTAAGLPFGSASGVIYKNIPWFIRRAYAVPYAVSEIEDYDERYFLLVRFAVAQRVSLIATPNPSTLLRLARVCADRQEDLIRAVYDGTTGINNRSGVFAELAAMLRPDPQRAATLTRIVAEKGFLRPAECWPDLRLIGCWLGGSVGAQAGQLAEFYGSVPLRDLGLMASEGNMTLPFEDHTSAGILALQNNYYEFIPEEESESEQPVCLSAGELEPGRRYSILLTNAAGLYRYRLNDIVEVRGFYRRAPLIAFIRKAGEMANITGEKMHANHLLEAFGRVCRKFGLKIGQFRAAPDVRCVRYEIYLELQQKFSPARLLSELDRVLRQVNIEYSQKRRSGRLGAPRLHLMKSGWADELLRRHIADGKRDTQYKPRILCSAPAPEDAPFIRQTVEMAEAEVAKPAAAAGVFGNG